MTQTFQAKYLMTLRVVPQDKELGFKDIFQKALEYELYLVTPGGLGLDGPVEWNEVYPQILTCGFNLLPPAVVKGCVQAISKAEVSKRIPTTEDIWVCMEPIHPQDKGEDILYFFLNKDERWEYSDLKPSSQGPINIYKQLLVGRPYDSSRGTDFHYH